MPIRARTASASWRGSVMSSPSSRTTPSSTSSSRSTVRSRVDLPDPDAPMSTTQRCAATSRSTPSRTTFVPNALRTPRTSSSGAAAARRRRRAGRADGAGAPARASPHRSAPAPASPLVAPAQPPRRDSASVARVSGIVSSTKSTPGDDVRREVGVLRGGDLRGADRVDRAEDRDEPGVLLQRDQVVEQRRHHPADRLRQHDGPQGLRAAQPERPGRRDLRGVDRLDARPEHLGDVGGVGEHEREPAQDDGRRRDPLQAQPGQPEPDEQQHEDERQPAEDVDVRRRRRAQREEHRTAQGAGDRERERDHEDHDGGDRHDAQVEPQPLDDAGERRDATSGSKNDCRTRGHPGELVSARTATRRPSPC